MNVTIIITITHAKCLGTISGQKTLHGYGLAYFFALSTEEHMTSKTPQTH